MGGATGISLGGVAVSRVAESERNRVGLKRLFAMADPALVEANRGWLAPHFIDADGSLLMNIQAYVLRTRHHVILVDACVGSDKERPLAEFSHLQSPWLAALAAAGVTPEQVDFVMCTHLHFDHVGWNTRLDNGRWVPTFPNARYLFARPEWEYWQDEHAAGRDRDGAIADSVLPIVEAGRAVMVEADHAVDDEVWLEHTPGHTPGHVCVHVGGARGGAGGAGILTGDLLHHPAQLLAPEWDVGASADAPRALLSRRGFIERNADSGRLILAAHFNAPRGGRIVSAGGGLRFAD